MALGRRRRRRWRRYLTRNRFSAAEGLLGLVALAVGLALLWPEPEHTGVDHRAMWEQSLRRAAESKVALADTPDAAVDVSEAEPVEPAAVPPRQLVAITAAPPPPLVEAGPIETHATGETHAAIETHAGEESASSDGAQQQRLLKVQRTMPEIGPPSAADLTGPQLAAVEPSPRPAIDPSDQPSPERRDLGASIDATPEPAAGAASPRHMLSARGGTPHWLRQAAAPPDADSRPVIAVVLDDLGMNRRATAALNKLKAPLTLAFLPYAGDLARQTKSAAAAGHELVLHLPMEPEGDEWPGPNALLSTLPAEIFRARLQSNLDRFEGYVGINNHMGSLLTTSRERMAVVMTELRRRDLLFLDSRTSAKSIAADEARRHGIPHAVRDVFIDHVIELEAIEKRLAQVERIAKLNGVAVAIGHPHAPTLQALRRWLPTLERRGFKLVPISTVVAHKACADRLIDSVAACGSYRVARSRIR